MRGRAMQCWISDSIPDSMVDSRGRLWPRPSNSFQARGRAHVIIGQANLPTYATVADVLEKKNGSGLRLAGWTIARMIMIAPPMMLVGVPAAIAFKGAALSSGLISLFTMIRIHHAAAQQGVHA
jgi:hypothetical protein